jgi:hypothetical protein
MSFYFVEKVESLFFCFENLDMKKYHNINVNGNNFYININVD